MLSDLLFHQITFPTFIHDILRFTFRILRIARLYVIIPLNTSIWLDHLCRQRRAWRNSARPPPDLQYLDPLHALRQEQKLQRLVHCVNTDYNRMAASADSINPAFLRHHHRHRHRHHQEKTPLLQTHHQRTRPVLSRSLPISQITTQYSQGRCQTARLPPARLTSRCLTSGASSSRSKRSCTRTNSPLASQSSAQKRCPRG